MSEKEKAEALRRARTVQPGESHSKIPGWQKELAENEAHEAELYAHRGYGGYIDTEQIEAIRATTQELVANIERERRG